FGRGEFTATDSTRTFPHGFIGLVRLVIDELDVFNSNDVVIIPDGFLNEILSFFSSGWPTRELCALRHRPSILAAAR
ncbi:MAG: hypothetical protein ACRD9L_26210, partial [Bryobacteraceae bacterium]